MTFLTKLDHLNYNLLKLDRFIVFCLEAIKMTLAQTITKTKKNDDHDLWKLPKQSAALLIRLWWHTKAYTTVLGIMLLTFASLGFLYIHWSGRKLTQIFKHNTVVESE